MAVKQKRVKIIPRAPLSLGRGRNASNFLETEAFVPGSTLRGAVAGRLLEACLDENYLDNHALCPERARCPFWQVFGHVRPPLFRDAMATTGEERRLAGPYPFPLTARTCKMNPGFVNPRKPDENHGIFDVMIRQAVFEAMIDRRVQLAALFQGDCPVCRRGTTNRPGDYEVVWEDGSRRYSQPGELLIERITHTAINRRRGVAEDALLYTVEQLPVDQARVFWGEVVFDEEYETALIEALVAEQRLGRSASRGLARAEVSIADPPPEQPLADRLDRLNNLIRNELRFYAAMGAQISTDLDGLYFSLDLVSEAIVNQPTPTVMPEPKRLGLPDGVVLVRAWARPTLVSGWNSAARLPRRTQVAVERGGVYLFRAPVSQDKNQLLACLESLELCGIGHDRQRGYGQVLACAPIHLEVNPI